MVRFVLDLDDVDEHDAGRVGNKAARLGQLRAAGSLVPPEFGWMAKRGS
jgi:phosphoenolpyruvate synthase/pyruvate phosphate dikinase